MSPRRCPAPCAFGLQPPGPLALPAEALQEEVRSGRPSNGRAFGEAGAAVPQSQPIPDNPTQQISHPRRGVFPGGLKVGRA